RRGSADASAAPLRQDNAVLQADLVRWASKRGGDAAGRRAARWLRLGGRLGGLMRRLAAGPRT
ncbi:MAG TPA: hypothetical protein VN923_16815, partial [Thermoanaerobaculia bacterium]|nr:hypothetical protein [Thermoanaerobaculia bacterium]